MFTQKKAGVGVKCTEKILEDQRAKNIERNLCSRRELINAKVRAVDTSFLFKSKARYAELPDKMQERDKITQNIRNKTKIESLTICRMQKL